MTKAADLLLLMESKMRCPAATRLLLSLLSLDPAQRIDCRSALEMSDFLARDSGYQEDLDIEREENFHDKFARGLERKRSEEDETTGKKISRRAEDIYF